MAKLTRQDIKRILQKDFQEYMDRDERFRATKGPEDTTWEPGRKAWVESKILGIYTDHLARCDNSLATLWAKDLLERNGLEAEPESEEFQVLCRELIKWMYHRDQLLHRRDRGDYSEDPTHSFAHAANPPEETQAIQEGESHESARLSDVIERYREDRKAGDNWKEKSEKEIMGSLSLFLEIVGDQPVNRIDAAMVRDFKDIIQKLPPDLRKQQKQLGKTARELAQMESAGGTLAARTVNKHLGRVKAVLGFAENEGFIARNPAKGMAIRVKTRADKDRDSFTPEDLEALFGTPEYRGDRHKHPYQFWMPVLGLFTGARLTELAQLHLEDIRQESGVWVLDLNDNTEDKELKNATSERLIPLHPLIAEYLDLPGYVDTVKQRKNTRQLFPELTKGAGGCGKNVTRWFGQYRDRLGIVGKKSFHSFRHTFAAQLQAHGVDMPLIKDALGHSRDGVTSRYTGSNTAQKLYEEAILKLDFGVDLSHLAGCRFAGPGARKTNGPVTP
ncbi:MAG: site-specific integrase [Proteobacteria bacterium]|nr:site-specific integrase [Pseudomonadota bacterium]